MRGRVKEVSERGRTKVIVEQRKSEKVRVRKSEWKSESESGREKGSGSFASI